MSKPILEDLFTFSGRRNRQSFILSQLTLMLALFLSYLVFFAALATATVLGTLLSAVALGVIIAVLVCGWAVCAQRVRDIGYPGWWSVALLVPWLNFAVWVALAVAPGEVGENRFGKNPLENT